ncbi:hypothetical protein WMF20_14535 [Sorangium sp. So ce834]|uniref:hypothetical protein n=1 Tax=Sorangium sp. So ce834 TaxID=3133321 RepID=UPI003F633404
MSDSYIYQRDIEEYGRFTASQIRTLVVPVDAGFQQALRAVAARLDAATAASRKAMLEAIAAAAAAPASSAARRRQADAVARGRDLLRRLVERAASRPGGVALARDLLQGQSLATVLRARPAKLAEALAHAAEVLEQRKRPLPEGEAWGAELERARGALDPFLRSVRKTRLARRTMTPEVKAARAEWLTVYGAAKLLVECVLRLHGKVPLMPQIFDDLAGAGRAPGEPVSPAQRPATRAA